MKIKIYIDFDGVILDTWSVIFEYYQSKYKTAIIDDNVLKQCMLDIGWNNILNQSVEINDSLDKIKKLKKFFQICILTKVNSKEEQVFKEKFLRKNNIYDAIFVPYNLSKTDYVVSSGCILIDDDVCNLEDWKNHDGISVLFNKHMKNIDSYGVRSDKFIIIDDLLKIYDIIKNR